MGKHAGMQQYGHLRTIMEHIVQSQEKWVRILEGSQEQHPRI